MKTVQSPRMIGRASESEAMRIALGDTLDGRFAAVLLSGEAGIGKTRLIREFLRHASDVGARTLVGNCVALSSGTLPFGPFVEILRHARRWDEADSVAIMDQLTGELDQTAEPPDSESRATTPVTAAFARTRPFGLAVQLLEALSRRSPLVVVIEDAHWADSSSLDLIRFLQATLGDDPILLVVSFRSDALGVAGSPCRRPILRTTASPATSG